MNLEEKKQIYLDRFPAIIGKRMAEQLMESEFDNKDDALRVLISFFNTWSETNEKERFWKDIHKIYCKNETIEHQQILDIFHKHNIKP